MTYYFLAICLALAAFLSLNALGSLIVTAAWMAFRRRTNRWSAGARATALFALRVLPPACALVFVATLLIPAYLIYEPYPAPESVGLPLLALAVFSASGIALALYRAVASWLLTRRLTARWLRQAEPMSVEAVGVPAYRLRNTTPVLAVVGTLRPRLFIAEQVLDSLSPEEMGVALAHERAHLRARDTLKRAVVNLCRSLVPLIGAGRALDRAWAEEAERAADEYAASADAAGALDLAAALIKIARLMPAGVGNVVPAGAFLLEGADEGVAGRVRRLTEMASTRSANAGRELLPAKVAVPAGLALFTGTLLAAADREFLAAIHSFTEGVLKILA